MEHLPLSCVEILAAQAATLKGLANGDLDRPAASYISRTDLIQHQEPQAAHLPQFISPAFRSKEVQRGLASFDKIRRGLEREFDNLEDIK